MTQSSTRGSGCDGYLSRVLKEAAAGRFPDWDGRIETVPAPRGAVAALFSFAGHNIVAADGDPEWVSGYCPGGDLSAQMRGNFLSELGRRVEVVQGPVDIIFAATAVAGRPTARANPSG